MDADGYSVARLVDDIKWLGYTKLLLRSDNEAAIVSLLTAALRKFKTEGIAQVAKEKPRITIRGQTDPSRTQSNKYKDYYALSS